MASSLPITLEMVTLPNQVNDLSKDATDYIDTISDPILFDAMLRDKENRDKPAKCSEIFGFTIRKLTSEECVKFEIDSSKEYQIITGIKPESVASISGLKIGDILIGIYNTNGLIRQIFDFVDEDALYNIYGNKLFDTRTILYISFRVLRYVYKNIFDFNLDYVDVLVIDLKTLHHTLRFALPFTNNDENDTIINFGSAYFEKYIDGLTDNTQQMGGGKEDDKARGAVAGPASAASAASAAIPSSQDRGGIVVGRRPQTAVQKTIEEFKQLIALEKTLPPGPQKTAMQEQIAKMQKIQEENRRNTQEREALRAEERRIRALPLKERRALAEAKLQQDEQALAAQQQALNEQLEQQQAFTTSLSSLFKARQPEISPEQLEREIANYQEDITREQQQQQQQQQSSRRAQRRFRHRATTHSAVWPHAGTTGARSLAAVCLS